MAASPRLSVVARGDREIVLSRRFDAPRRLVFAAWTTPDLFVRWFGAREWTVPVCEMDVRPGGRYRYRLRGPDGQEVEMTGVYREVVPPERLVTTERFVGFAEVGWRPEDETVTTAVLSEQDGRTTWTATVLYPSREVRDAALDSPMERGLGEGLDRLADLLGTLA